MQMKLYKLLSLVVGLFLVALVVDTAIAGYVQEESLELYEYVLTPPGVQSSSFTWDHLASGIGITQEDGHNVAVVTFVSLTIVADDVDGLPYPENDVIYVFQGDGSQEDPSLLELGRLIQLRVWDNFNYHEGPGYDWHTTTTVFDSNTIPELLNLNFDLPLHVRVEVPQYFGVEIETSTLHIERTVVPIPSAAWLLGSGLLCLVGVSRRISRRRQAAS